VELICHPVMRSLEAVYGLVDETIESVAKREHPALTALGFSLYAPLSPERAKLFRSAFPGLRALHVAGVPLSAALLGGPLGAGLEDLTLELELEQFAGNIGRLWPAANACNSLRGFATKLWRRGWTLELARGPSTRFDQLSLRPSSPEATADLDLFRALLGPIPQAALGALTISGVSAEQQAAVRAVCSGFTSAAVQFEGSSKSPR